MGPRTLILLALAWGSYAADPTAARIEAVENGLLPAIVIKGQPAAKKRLTDRMRELKVRGVSLAVIHNYKIDWAKGYGVLDDESGKPVNTETLFQAGSISKPVAVTAAMKLIEEGKLSLDEDVNVKLKSWKVPENEFTKEQKVTLRRTMSHSAGLTVHGFPGYEAGAPVPTAPQILDGQKPANTAPVRVNVVPGTLGRYSGGGTTIMQLLMIDVTGKPFPELMWDLVLSKGGMTNSTYEQPLPERLRANTASGYRANGDAVKGKYHTYPEMAAAGLWTTASDLARFAIEIGKSRDGSSNRILKTATVQEMLKPQKDDFGLGFALENGAVKRFGHNGADAGFQANLTCSFEGEGVAVMVNSDNGLRLASEIARAVSAAYGWADLKPREKTLVPLTAAQLSAYAGEYDSVPIKVRVRVQGDHLVLTPSDWPQIEFYPEGGETFFSSTGDFPPLKFDRTDGAITGLTAGALRGRKVQ